MEAISAVVLAITLAVGIAVGLLIGWLAHAYRAGAGLARAEAALAAAENDRAAWESSLEQSAAEAARHSAGALGETVGQAVGPLREAVGALEGHLRQVERHREGAYAGLREQVAAIDRSNRELSAQTTRLASALRSPNVRGRWGELQLERVVELAGMQRHCDFDTQVTAAAPDGSSSARVRPDMLVHLAGGRQVVVDAKAPLSSYLDSLAAQSEPEREKLLFAHASAMRAHIDRLSAKAYWRAFDPTPEFVVLFVPGEAFLDAAASTDRGLLEYAFGRSVVLATPTTLMALLRTVGLGWRHDALSHEARNIHALGTELCRRLETMTGHFERMGGQLGKTVESFNSAVASFESRVMVTARSLAELQMLDTGDTAVGQVDTAPRTVARTDTPRRDGAADGAAHAGRVNLDG